MIEVKYLHMYVIWTTLLNLAKWNWKFWTLFKITFWTFFYYRPLFSSAPWPWAKLTSTTDSLTILPGPSTMLLLPLWLPTRKFVYLLIISALCLQFFLFQSMFPPTYWCLPKPFWSIRSTRIFLQLRRWMWTLRFVRSCHQRSSRMRHLLFRWKSRLYGHLRKGQGCLHLLWSPLNHSFLKIENKTVWRKEKFCATYFYTKLGISSHPCRWIFLSR